MSLTISDGIDIPLEEVQLEAVRATGAGGQHVNKVATAIHLRFEIDSSSLPESCKDRLRRCTDKRISKDGVIVIKAQRFRSQERNRADALERLRSLVRSAIRSQRRRRPTGPTAASRQKRLDRKTRRGRLKALRRNVDA
ncbi:MAG: alternative ribosome rescue aminoacyl-tRNA hydrolase ArfB [Halioglobus sp.]|nr:alternative ribosome rescue aminoacyl-tRNA hydrolase ArfB [Halioglobus sp.]